MLWLCLHLPFLPLEVFTRGAEAPGLLAVAEGRGSRRRFVAATPAALAEGVGPGLALGAAHALAPGLVVRDRDEAAEAAALSGLAAWAGQFTPALSLSPRAVLLEVEGSLGLFAGAEGLSERVRRGGRAMGYRASVALAPTALAAELLAGAGRETLVLRRQDLEAALAPLPLHVLGLPEDRRQALRRLGLRTLGDLLALPRSGLARRFGQGLLDLLDRALGRLPDPRPSFALPPRFAAGLELPAEVSGAGGLLFAAHRLLLELEGFLRARGAGARSFSLELRHREGEPTRLRVGLAAPGRDPLRLAGLLRERLECMVLPAPVGALRLTTADLEPLSSREGDLFAVAGETGEDGLRLVERLRARLGEEAVQGLTLAADHRPERAFRWTAPLRAEPPRPACAGARPLWLLPEPEAACREGLSLLAGPERLESGWWDGADAARDYYVAEDAGGSRLWVFRERREGRWFVHGIFG